MNKVHLITLAALLLVVSLLPVYALQESARLVKSQEHLLEVQLEEAAITYLDDCSSCHGLSGEGLNSMPALNNPALATAEADILFKTIARAAHGTTMAAWHIDEGGVLNSYQINELVTLIRFGDWNQVAETGKARKVSIVNEAFPGMEEAFLSASATDPHQCAACHEDPAVHKDRFGLDCARCHTTLAWAPALLTHHTFELDHGGEALSCETCHAGTYAAHDCYACHTDHQPAEMKSAHLAYGITELQYCVSCHPTGAPGEAEKLQQTMEGSGLTTISSLP